MRTKQPTPEEMAVLEETLAVLAEENPEILNEFVPAVARFAATQGGKEAAKLMATKGGTQLAAQSGKEAARQFIKNTAKKIIDSAKKELMNMAKEQAITLVKNKIIEKAPDSMKGIVSGLLESPLVAAAFQEEIHGKSAPGVKTGDPQITSPGTASARDAITEGSVEEKTIIIEEILNALNEAHCNSAHGRDTAIMPMGGPLASAIAPLPPIGSPVGGCGDGDPHVSKTHKEYDDTHMLKKSLEILANQALALHDAIAGGMTLPSWAEAKVYCATDDIKGVHANLDRGRVASGPQAPIIQLAEAYTRRDLDLTQKELVKHLDREDSPLQKAANNLVKLKFEDPNIEPFIETVVDTILDIEARNRADEYLTDLSALRSRKAEEKDRAEKLIPKLQITIQSALNTYLEGARKNLANKIVSTVVAKIVNEMKNNMKPQKDRSGEAFAATVGAPSIERESTKNKQ